MGQAFLVCRCVNERARIPVGADSISAREVCGGARCADAYRMRPYGQANSDTSAFIMKMKCHSRDCSIIANVFQIVNAVLHIF